MKPLLNTLHVSIYAQECYDVFNPETGVKTIAEYVRRVEKLASKFEPDENGINAFKGGMFELFAEIFFNKYDADPAVGIKDYKPIPLWEDNGVDATGINVAGNLCVIQNKYRNNPNDYIRWGDLSKTFGAGLCSHGLKNHTTDDSVILFTTCNSVSYTAVKQLGTRLRLIGRSIIAGYIDNNVIFWEYAWQRILITFQELKIELV